MGFEAFNKYIARAQPRLFLHGHQHVDAETMAGATRVMGVNRFEGCWRYDMRHELRLYATWYNGHRPHESLGARTP